MCGLSGVRRHWMTVPLQFGYTPLLLACWLGHVDLARLLVDDKGVDYRSEKTKVACRWLARPVPLLIAASHCIGASVTGGGCDCAGWLLCPVVCCVQRRSIRCSVADRGEGDGLSSRKGQCMCFCLLALYRIGRVC